MGRIVLLGSSDIGNRYAAEAVKSLGHSPFFLSELLDYQADPRRQIEAYEHAECLSNDADTVIATLARLGVAEIVAVTSFDDTRLLTAREVASRLGVRGLDASVSALKNKGIVAKLVAEYSPPGVVFHPDHVPVSEIENMLQTFGKVLLKPVGAAGALGVFTVSSLTEIREITHRIIEKRIPTDMDAGGWIAQAFLEGDLASLEGYVLAGKVHTLGFSSRKKVGATESAASFPADALIAPAARERASVALSALVERSGFLNGYFHVEFIFGKATSGAVNGCHLIDANMGRMGGGPVGELLALAHGVDPIEIYRHVLEVSLFQTESRNPYQKASQREECTAVLYGLEKGGELDAVEFPTDTNCFHTQILGTGAEVTPMGTDDWSWIGIVSGLRKDTMSAVERVRIRTTDGVHPPCF